jgi:hypothetical protein
MEFVFKRALIRPEETWQISGTRLVGPKEEIDLKDTTSCNFNYTIFGKGMTSSELTIVTPGRTVSLDCVGKPKTVHRDVFLGMVSEILSTIEIDNPDLKVTSTGTSTMAWGFAAIGTLCALWGIYFAAANYADSSGNFALGIGGFMVLMGAFMIWAGSPWKANQPKTLLEAREWIERLRAL